MKFRKFGIEACLALALACLSVATPSQAQTPITLALPAQSLLFAPIYIAQERGIFRAHGLDLKLIYVAGPGVMTAVLSKSADFTVISGGIHIAAAARNQKLLAIANTQDKITTDIVLRDEVAKKLNVPDTADALTKMKAMKGLTIGVDAINGLPHSIVRFLAANAGMNPETDFTITALQAPAMVAALKNGNIDAMAFSPPFSLIAVKEGGVRWISGPDVRLPEFESFPYSVVLVRPGYCANEGARCREFLTALKEAIALMKSDPEASLKALAPTFEKMDPEALKSSFEVFARFAQSDLQLTSTMFHNVISFDELGGLIPPLVKLPAEKELYSSEFLPR